jgi:hypothetical protein
MLSRHLQGQGFPISCSHDTWSESFLVSHGLNPCAAQTTGFSLSGSYWAGLTPGFPVKRTGGLLPAWYLASTHQSLECGVRMTSPAACAGLTWSTARQTNMACVNLKNKHDLCLKRLESQISSHFTRWKGWRALLQVDSQLYYLFMPYWWSLSFLLQFLEKKLSMALHICIQERVPRTHARVLEDIFVNLIYGWGEHCKRKHTSMRVRDC